MVAAVWFQERARFDVRDFNDAVLPQAATLWASLVESYLPAEEGPHHG